MLRTLFLGTAPIRSRAAPSFLSVSRGFSDSGTHDDFAPKKKAVAHDLSDPKAVQELIAEHVAAHPVLLYMKGTPSAPQCGFSQQTVRVLHALGVEFSSVNILEHPEIREGIKVYSEWPTIPQLYVKGEFVGGCDIITDQYKSGDLLDLLQQHKLVE